MDLPSSPQEKPKPLKNLPSCLEIRLFYVRISPCSSESVPQTLILSHLRREIGVSLEINSSLIPPSDRTFLALRRDRIDFISGEVFYLCTDCIRITGFVEFEVCDKDGILILCGSLENMDSCGELGGRWSMNCFSASSIAGRLGVSLSEIEVYVAGCFAGSPLILMQTIQVSPRKKVGRLGALDVIPEDKEAGCDLRSCREVFPCTAGSLPNEDGCDEYNPEMNAVGHSYHPEELYSEEDGQLSWFNAGVRVGVGIGLGMCIGVGIGAGLLMRTYQVTTRSFRRRFF